MKSELIFQTGVESLSQPIDVASTSKTTQVAANVSTTRVLDTANALPNTSTTQTSSPISSVIDKALASTYSVKRVSPQQIDFIDTTSSTDDVLSLSESGYDKFIVEKGVNSTQASVVAIVPLRKESSEESIITVQRGLSKAVLTKAEAIVNTVTGSFTSAQLTDFNAGYTSEYNQLVDNIIAVYRAKVSYLTFIDDFYNLQTTDSTSWMLINPQITYNITTNITNTSIDFTVRNLSGFSQASSTTDWATRLMSVSVTDSRLNVTKMLQLSRNCYGILKYASISTQPVSDNTFSIEPIYNDVYDQSIDLLNSIYDNSYNLTSTMTEQVTDNIFTTLAKDISLQYSSGFSETGADVKTTFRSALGGLSDISNEQDLSSNKSTGVFNDLLSLTNDGRFVLSLDNAAQSQSFLSDYIVADQYYLIDPIANDLNLLDTRSQAFQTIYQNIYDNLDTLRKKMSLSNDTTMFFEFLSCISAYIDRTFMTQIPVTVVDRQNSALLFNLIMKSADDPTLLSILFKTAALRDRMRNPGDYEKDSTKVGTLKARALAGIKVQASRLSEKLSLTSYPTCVSADNVTEKTLELLNLILPTVANAVTPSEDQQENVTSDTVWSGLWKSSVLDPFLVDDAIQLDIFYEFAKNLEKSSTLTSTSMTSDDPLTARVGIISQFIDSNRDHRAFSFLLKMIYWFKNIVNSSSSAVFQLTSYSEDSTTVVSGDGTSTSTRQRIYYSLYYDPLFFSNIKGIIDKVLSLPNILTTVDTQLPADQTGYKNQLEFTALTLGTSGGIDAVTAAEVYLGIPADEVISAEYDGIYLIATRRVTKDTGTVYDNNVKILVDGLLKPTMFKSQVIYDTFGYILDYLSQANTLLYTAAIAAKSYVPTYGESLATLYTANTVAWLERCRQNGLKTSDFNHYTRDYYRSSSYLLGMLNYADTIIPEQEDSFVVICGIPYGMLERLGAFKLGVERDVSITLTFRDVNYGTTTRFEKTYTFPAVSFVDQSTQEYTTNDIGTQENLVNVTSLKYLDQNGHISTDNFTSTTIKTQEIQSNSMLEYIRLLYGLDFDINAFHQNQAVDVTSAYPNLAGAKLKLDNYVAGLPINQLVKSRYTKSVDNVVELQKAQIMKESIQGFVFDKIVAIPISGTDLSGSENFYLCDLIISVELSTSTITTTTSSTVTTTDAGITMSAPLGSRSSEINTIITSAGVVK